MHKQEDKMNQDIPIASNKTLLIATLSAVILSILIYFTVILPAEYNVDPTGVGKKLGLTVLSEPVSPVEIKQETPNKNTGEDTINFREDTVLVTVPAQRGVEYKFKLNEFDHLNYEWQTKNGESIYFDFHGEPQGDTTGYFESFTIATTHQMKGSATVPFEGSHGWYWKNTTDDDITINLITSGNYTIIGLKK